MHVSLVPVAPVADSLNASNMANGMERTGCLS